jgi:hypothetical protein
MGERDGNFHLGMEATPVEMMAETMGMKIAKIAAEAVGREGMAMEEETVGVQEMEMAAATEEGGEFLRPIAPVRDE